MNYSKAVEHLRAVMHMMRKAGHTENNGQMGYVLIDLERITNIFEARAKDGSIQEPSQRIQSMRDYQSQIMTVTRMVEEYHPETIDPEVEKIRKAEGVRAGIVKGKKTPKLNLGSLPDEIPADDVLKTYHRDSLIRLAQKFGTCDDGSDVWIMMGLIKYRNGRKNAKVK
jgi:hypothetical protein